jgi:hypothetical protein
MRINCKTNLEGWNPYYVDDVGKGYFAEVPNHLFLTFKLINYDKPKMGIDLGFA